MRISPTPFATAARWKLHLSTAAVRSRHRAESVYKWELDKGDESLVIAVNGSRLLDELDLVIQAALDGAGLAWVAEDRVAEHLGSGALVRVLEDRCPPFPGFLLYYSSRDSCSLGADRHASRLAESPFGTALMMSAGDAPILETTESDCARLADVSHRCTRPSIDAVSC